MRGKIANPTVWESNNSQVNATANNRPIRIAYMLNQIAAHPCLMERRWFGRSAHQFGRQIIEGRSLFFTLEKKTVQQKSEVPWQS
jgi:hypothetical protein